MYMLHLCEIILHVLSMITASIVILKILVYDRVGVITKLCICLIYSSAYVTDSSIIYMVYCKIQDNIYMVHYRLIVTTEANPYRTSTFTHEIGCWIYFFAVFLTASERLFHGHFNTKDQSCNLKVFLAIPIILLVIGVSSYYCTTLLLSENYQLHAEILIVSTQIFGVMALLYTLYLNEKRYKNGVGESLEQRYQSAYVFKFNKSVIKSLVGEVTTRFIAFSFILMITFGMTEMPVYGWIAIAYFNLIPIGNIVFPWFIVLRHVKIDWATIRGKKSNAVRDLHGRNLAMTLSSEEHFTTLNKAWG